VIRATAATHGERAALLGRARAQLRAALELDPKLPEAHTELAFTYLLPGEPAAQAVVHAERAFALLPSCFEVALQFAEALSAAGEPARALPLLTRLRFEAARSRAYATYLDRLIADAKQASVGR
jgi:Tfp pilus assembly protein PilF